MGCNPKILFIIMLVIKSCMLIRQNCCRSNHFRLLADNSRADVPPIRIEVGQVISICTQICSAQTLCASFSYHSATKDCHLHAYNHFENTANMLIPSPGWSFYQKTTLQAKSNCLDCSDWQAIDASEDGFGCRCYNLDNIALRKPTSQSSTCYYGYSLRAVDGDTSTQYRNSPSQTGGCSHTCIGVSMWWMVDFGQNAIVSWINITNRGDCCGNRLSNFNIRIGDVSGGGGGANPLCISNAGVPQGDTKSFRCSSKLKGRYLSIKTNLNEALTLCEVKVFGELV